MTTHRPIAPLTPRQAEVLAFIREYVAGHHYPPTIRDLAARFAMATNGAECHLRALAKKRYIRRVPHAARGIVLVENGKCPYCGRFK